MNQWPPKAVTPHTRELGDCPLSPPQTPTRVFPFRTRETECALGQGVRGSWTVKGNGSARCHPPSPVPAPLAPLTPSKTDGFFLLGQTKSSPPSPRGRDKRSSRLGLPGRTPRAVPCLQLFFYYLVPGVEGAKRAIREKHDNWEVAGNAGAGG